MPRLPVHHQLLESAQLLSIKLMMSSNHLILCHPPLHLASIVPSIRVLSNESVLHIRWPKYWSLIFSISPSNEYSGLISFRIDWFDLLGVQRALKSLLQHHSFKSINSSILYDPTLTSIRDYWKNHSFDLTKLSWQNNVSAIIFSQSEGCLFTLLIVSFVVQKLLSFIRSHFFIFAFISNILGGGL